MEKCTFWDILTSYNKYDGSKTAHQDIINTLKKHNHNIKMSANWQIATIIAVFYDADGIDIIGGYSQTYTDIISKAKKIGIWHNGTTGVRPGDIILYCDNNKKPNHIDFCIGYNRTIAGDYNGGCSRRTYKNRSILGYIRPKYETMPIMNNLQIIICAAEVLLGTYGSGTNRTNALSVFETKNAKTIQNKVNQIAIKESNTIYALAIATIAGYTGNGDYRTKRLSSWNNKVQKRINEIYSLKGKTIQAAAHDVLAGKFDKGEIRILLLHFCGYDVNKIQKKVNELLTQSNNRIRIHQIWVSESNNSLYGDSYLITEYANDNKTIKNCVLIDTGPGNGDTLKKLKKLNLPKIDAIFLSHGHGDHVDGLEPICKTFKVYNVFISDYKEMQGVSAAKGAISKLKTAAAIAKKYGANYKYISNDFTWSAGNIKLEWSWQAKKSKLKQFDDHHFVNMLSIGLMFNLNGWKFFTAGDLSYQAIDALVEEKANKLKCHVFKIQWHSDRNGIKVIQVNACLPNVGLSNYHHSKSNGGRLSTYNLFIDKGAIVMMAYENGECYVDCYSDSMTISCSKNNLNKTFYK